MKQPDAELTFEAAVLRLEEIVAAMEGGGLSLDESLRHFEQAVALSRQCAATLDEAEKKIQVLNAEGEPHAQATVSWAYEAEVQDPFAN